MNAERELLAGELFLDEGIEAARNACVAGASLAAALVTAAAYYDNPFTGAPALRACMSRFGGLPLALPAWLSEAAPKKYDRADVPFVPGFGFVLSDRANVVLTECRRLVARGAAGPRCRFVLEHHSALARTAGALNATGVAALFFLDQGVDIDVAERRFLLLRSEVALVEAEKARRAGLQAFPFLSDRHVYEGHMPPAVPLDVPALMQRLGLDTDA